MSKLQNTGEKIRKVLVKKCVRIRKFENYKILKFRISKFLALMFFAVQVQRVVFCTKKIPDYSLDVINKTPYKDFSELVLSYGKRKGENIVQVEIFGIDEKVEFFDEIGRPRGFSIYVRFSWNVSCWNGKEMKGEHRIKRIFSAPTQEIYISIRNSVRKQIAREIVRFLESKVLLCEDEK